MENVIVKSKELADAFANLGIAATVEGQSSGGSDDLLKGQIDALNKAVSEKDAEIEELRKGVTGAPADMLSKAESTAQFQALGLISKALFDKLESMTESVEELTKSFQEEISSLKEEVETIGSSSVGRHTLSTDNGIEKAFSVDERSGKKRLSKSHHGKAIADVLDRISDASEDAEVKEMFSDASVRFETTRALTKAVVDKLNSEHDIIITD